MSSEQVVRIDPEVHTPHGGAVRAGDVMPASRKPGYSYRYASPSGTHSVDWFASIGWELVKYGDGERIMGGMGQGLGKTPAKGEPVMHAGQALMRISTDRLRELQLHGANGNGGLKLADYREETLLGGKRPAGVEGRVGATRELAAQAASIGCVAKTHKPE